MSVALMSVRESFWGEPNLSIPLRASLSGVCSSFMDTCNSYWHAAHECGFSERPRVLPGRPTSLYSVVCRVTRCQLSVHGSFQLVLDRC